MPGAGPVRFFYFPAINSERRATKYFRIRTKTLVYFENKYIIRIFPPIEPLTESLISSAVINLRSNNLKSWFPLKY